MGNWRSMSCLSCNMGNIFPGAEKIINHNESIKCVTLVTKIITIMIHGKRLTQNCFLSTEHIPRWFHGSSYRIELILRNVLYNINYTTNKGIQRGKWTMNLKSSNVNSFGRNGHAYVSVELDHNLPISFKNINLWF